MKALKKFINVEGNLAPEDCFLSREAAQYRFDEFVKDAFMDKLKQRLMQSPSKGVRIFADKFRREVSDLAFWSYCSSIVDYSDHCDLIQTFRETRNPKSIYLRFDEQPLIVPSNPAKGRNSYS